MRINELSNISSHIRFFGLSGAREATKKEKASEPIRLPMIPGTELVANMKPAELLEMQLRDQYAAIDKNRAKHVSKFFLGMTF